MIVSVAQRLAHVEEYYFLRKLEQIARMRASGIDVINLGIGSPDQMPPAKAIEQASVTIAATTSHGYSSYRSLPELRKAMSDWYRRTYDIALNPDNEILPLLGSKEGILYLSLAILNPGDGILIPNPGYPAYASVANLVGARTIAYDLTEETSWLPNMEKLEHMDLTGVKLMIVNYPHMPTGQVCDLTFFERLVAFAKNKKILICNDNPYGLVLNEEAPLSIFKADPNKEVTAEMNSLSKSFNMAGWRVGMFLGAKDVVEAVLKVKSNVDSGMFLPVQKGAIEALKTDDAWHESRNQIYKNRREIIFKMFDRLKFKYQKGQVGLFVWGKVPSEIKNVEAYLEEILEKSHVCLTPGFIFGSNGDRYARASLCVPEEKLKIALKNIEEFLK